MIDVETIFDSDREEYEFMQEKKEQPMKEQIEEIVKVMCINYGHCSECSLKNIDKDDTCSVYIEAEALYNAGYRKQRENTVEVVRCKDCKCKQIDAFGRTVCVRNGQMITIQDEGYCYYGERK